MIEISIRGEIDASVVVAAPVEEVEQMLHNEIGTNLTKEVIKHIDDMAFIDMELNEDNNKFEYQAELVLCSKSSIVTNIQIQAQLMAEYGLSQEQIERVLEIVTFDSKGF